MYGMILINSFNIRGHFGPSWITILFYFDCGHSVWSTPYVPIIDPNETEKEFPNSQARL